MDEESITIPVSPEIVISDEVCSRNSEGKPIALKSRASKPPDPRRASTGSFNNGGRKFNSGKTNSLSAGESPVPHYLRASTGSCHDFCKYGRKHETEVKPWQVKSRKVRNPAVPLKINSETGDLSDKKITKSEKSKLPPVSKANSPSSSAVSRNKIPSPSRPVSVKEDKAVNEKKKNVIERQNSPVFRVRRESDSGLAILPKLVSAKEKDMAVNEKKKNTIEKRITPTKGSDKSKGVSKEVTRKLVSSPVAYLATKPSFNSVLTLKGNANRSKKPVSNLKDQVKIKPEHKSTTNSTLKVKTEHAINVEAKETVEEVREKKQEGIKEVEIKLVESEKVSDETLSALKVDFEKVVPVSEENKYTIDIPLSESFSSPNISSQGKSSALTDAELDEDKVPKPEENENLLDSPRSESSSPRSISSSPKSPILSCSKEEDGDGLGFKETAQDESTIDILPSESLSSVNISSQDKSPALSDGYEEALVEPELANIEEKDPKSEENESTNGSLPSEVASSQNKSPALPCGEEEDQHELEYSDMESERSDVSISESSEAPNSDAEETSVRKGDSKTRMAKAVSEENEKATKLKFKRGKVVEIESNNSGPRRLRFRRARVLDENQDKDLKNRRRSFTKGGLDDSTDGTKDDSEKVVLRHQEVEGKKDAQGLFNNVIEETASKLVETRKSKVKALVGAFETVISLQESKPTTQTAVDEK